MCQAVPERVNKLLIGVVNEVFAVTLADTQRARRLLGSRRIR